ncbi:MAG: type III pantothenate kinase [Planctomycetaceae bacterium]|nr:type III pantothenate kinase [Planctomycetaceae bacterium]
MNVIAIDIGNTNITAALFLEDIEAGIEKTSGEKTEELTAVLENFWNRVPFVKAGKDKDKKRDARIVIASVNPKWTEVVKQIAQEKLDEKALEIGLGKDIPLPMGLDVDKPEAVGVDRVMAAFAAYCVVEDSVIVADFGTAVTIDAVNDKGIFLGGVILPGFDIAADGLNRHTAQLPKIEKVKAPQKPYGRNTEEAINNGLYYSAIGAIEVVTRLYSEQLGKWPQTVVTGGNMEIIRSGCDFVDSFVDDLVVKGIVLSFKKYIGEKM